MFNNDTKTNIKTTPATSQNSKSVTAAKKPTGLRELSLSSFKKITGGDYGPPVANCRIPGTC